jgi:gluconate 2-dehydrogenase alpha chain
MKALPSADVVVVGGGWTGLLIAKELGSRTAASVVVLERGGPRKTTDYFNTMDELENYVRLRMIHDFSTETVTLRHNHRQKALPLRQAGPFLPGVGTGGAGEHWGAVCDRMSPDSFEVLSKTVEKYGLKKLPEDHALQDWGVTYDEIEPFYSRAERLIGASGKAGNINGNKVDGGNVFEGWRSSEYPLPSTKIPYFSALFDGAAKRLGYHPYPSPAATLSAPYVNPDGVARPGCTYCGFCERYGCMIGAKAQPTNTLMPVIAKHKNVSIRNGAWVRRVVCDQTGPNSKSRGVTYVDASGQEFFQPADLVVLASWTLNNTRLLLLSGAGEPYNPSTGTGTVGRNLTHQVSFSPVLAFFEKPLNRFMGSGAAGVLIGDFSGHVLDHTQLPFIRGGTLQAPSHGYGPLGNFGAVPKSVETKWGAAWKKAAIHHYDRAGRLAFQGEHLAYKGNFMDLDPTYTDRNGDPLLRMTLDWRDNERRMADFAIAKSIEIARAMGATDFTPSHGLGSYDARVYQSSHLQGGTIMGKSSESSVVNPYLQHWQISNLFILGGSTFPQSSSARPTLAMLALTYRTADAIVDRYLKAPGPLVGS